MIIENNILSITNIIFKDKHLWEWVTDEQKEQHFFILNRFFSKMYPNYSSLLNNKNINKVMGMDMWFYFMRDKPYPRWFWSKSKNKKEKIEDELYRLFDITEEELLHISRFYPDELKEEVDYLNSLKKQK
jgi:hypothetical protein